MPRDVDRFGIEYVQLIEEERPVVGGDREVQMVLIGKSRIFRPVFWRSAPGPGSPMPEPDPG
jgi:hypothetical protein